ncbi:MAG: hypothetical protein EOS10_22500 [Mesorhizobium sp.]|uniref:hypothetical protein n=1 Tax=Mesorhizobium sp. TaxID=1871066 RepID=UPI000FE67825|nr:hypothetical protein [Mesorhizobium sp.]RWO29615.1 MAG: hypothetical protein EOS10_22500 [Mesorhizobium sp.]
MITYQQPVGCLSTTSHALAAPIVERMADRVLELSLYGTAVTKDVLFKHTDFTREEIDRHALEACDLARARAVSPLTMEQRVIKCSARCRAHEGAPRIAPDLIDDVDITVRLSAGDKKVWLREYDSEVAQPNDSKVTRPFHPLSPRQELISECEGLGLDGKAPRDWREIYSDAQLRSAIVWLDQAGSAADQLIAAAATEPRLETWISRQILAGQKPSQILAALAGMMNFRAIGGDGPAGLAFASTLVFVSTFAVLGWALPS